MSNKNKDSAIKGFTLIELSIVLIVISLIVATITAGSSIIHSAQLKSVISDISEFKTAINLYQDKYDALPGDHRNAYDYFSGGDRLICGYDNSAQDDGCNGNGDGIIHEHFSGESLKAWQHLQQADLITGRVKVNLTAARYRFPTVDPNHTANGETPPYYTPSIPPSKVKGHGENGYSFAHTNMHGRVGSLFGRVGNSIMLGGKSLGASAYNSGPSLNAADAYSIDKKIDDGAPNKGNVISTGTHNIPGTCTTNGPWWSAGNTMGQPWSSLYTLEDTTISCLIFFLIN